MTDFDPVGQERRRFPAPFAASSANSRGRKYPLSPDPCRTEYQRDRDRIIHSTAFRRLQHKTQVIVNLGQDQIAGDHHRTRLTHTIEVAQISRTIARAIGLNEDLAEAVALAHDLGHTPFGHGGEDTLNDLLADSGGFSHNDQSLRVVDFLEKRYPGHYGLNLTYELREAIVKHESDNYRPVADEFSPDEQPLLEGQIVNLADEIAYCGHDVDDGLTTGLLDMEKIADSGALVQVWGQAEAASQNGGEMLRFALVRALVNRYVLDLIGEIRRRLDEYGIGTIEDIRRCPVRLAAFSNGQEQFHVRLKSFLHENMYQHPALQAMKQQSSDIIRSLFSFYQGNMESIPTGFRIRFPDSPARQLIVDYIAGMTDRFALHEYRRLCQ